MKLDNTFVGSFDPFHAGHLNTWEAAEKKFGPTRIVVCKNDQKNDGRLTTEQRRIDIIYTLLMSDTFDKSKRDPEELVMVANDLESIAKVFTSSKNMIRGIRGPEDISYNELLMKKTGLEKIAKEKGQYIQVPSSHYDISSTTNKIVLQKFIKEYGHIPSVYRKIFGNTVRQRLLETDFTRKSREINLATHNKIQSNIISYFTKLESL